MTWPFENDTGAIVEKLATRSIKADKRSNFLLILTIALSVCMVLSIALSSAGIAERQKDAYRDKSQIAVIAPTEEQLTQIRENKDVQWSGEYSILGFSYQDGIKLIVAYADNDYLEKESGITFSGNLPKAADEILLGQDYIARYNLNLRTGDTITLDLTGIGKPSEYRVSGIVENHGQEFDKSSYVFVSKALAQKIADETLDGHLQITAYTRLNTKEISPDGILSAAYSVTRSAKIEDEQVFLTEYFSIMSGVIRTGLNISIPLITFITSVLAAVIIYGIFYTAMINNVQMLGQLRTIGMTKRQIKKMMKKNGWQFSVKGILLGLFLGTVVGFCVCPSGFRIKTALLYGVVAAFISAVAVKIAIYLPVKIASATSPIEGLRYLSYDGKGKSSRKLHRELTSFGLSAININRNRKKALFTFLTLGVSGIVFLTSALVGGSVDAEKRARFHYFPDGDIHIVLQDIARTTFDANGEYNYSTKLQLENNPLEDVEFIKQLYEVDGVEKITPHNAVMATITYPGVMGSITSIADNIPTITQEDFSHISQLLSDGNISYDEMTAQNGIIIEKNYATVGDTLTVNLRGADGSMQSVDAPVVGVYENSKLMEYYPLVPGNPYFLMTYDTIKNITGVSSQTGVLSLAVEQEKYDTVLSKIMDMADTSDSIACYDISQIIKNITAIYKSSIQNLYLISVVLFLFGGISLTSTLLVDFRNRSREFGLLRAVGTTERQLKKMLHGEILTYLAGSFIISIAGSSIASFVACSKLNEATHIISFTFPWLFLFAYVALLTVIYSVFSLYASSEIRKINIVESIRR